MHKKIFLIYTISFFTAAFSLIYELQYSQLLSLLYGNSVLRYSLTIGLYLFSLGVGSLSIRLLKKGGYERKLWLLQALLSFSGIIGLFGIIWMESVFFELFKLRLQNVSILLAHTPVIFTGILAGMQIPILSFLGNNFEKRDNMFVEVLGFDYFGSLLGAVAYGLFLYPEVGIIATAFIAAVLNFALAFICFKFVGFSRKIIFIGFVILLFVSFIGFKFNEIDDSLTTLNLITGIKKEKALNELGTDKINNGEGSDMYENDSDSIKIDDNFNTKYQEIVKYTIESNGIKDQCLKLSTHTNMCDSWANSYHDALVNVPMAFIPKKEKTLEVLLLGGGSLLPVKNLLNYDVNIDQVDIDKDFIDYAKNDPYFLKYHQNSWSSDRVHFYFEDAYTFLRHNQKKYDLVVMSLPGFGSDKLIHLGSMEFFIFLNRSLDEDSLVVTWEYGKIDKVNFPETSTPYDESAHIKTFFKNVQSAGFVSYFEYFSYLDVAGEKLPSDIFYIFQKNNKNRGIDFTRNMYVQENRKYMANLRWHQISDLKLEKIRPSRVFSPNYDIMTEL